MNKMKPRGAGLCAGTWIFILSLASLGHAQIIHEETKTGGASKSLSVTTSASLTGADGHLYLAAIVTKPKVSVTAVSGLGLSWTPLKKQCTGRNAAVVQLWMAIGTSSASPAEGVTAVLADTAASAVITVSRYSGVEAALPIGNVVAGNTNGKNGNCKGGADNSSYALDLTTTVDGALVYGVATMRAKTHISGVGYTGRAEILQGTGGNAVSLAVQDQSIALQSGANIVVDGTFSDVVDWAVVAVEIRPVGSGGPKQYTLTTSMSGNGSVDLNPAGGIYDAGTVVKLTAMPATGFEFGGWSGDLSPAGGNNPASIVMDADKNVQAIFKKISLGGPVVHEETQTGAAATSKTVTTATNLKAVDGHLYLAAISIKPKLSVSAVSGLGLNWTLVKAQCTGRNIADVEVWMAQATPGGRTLSGDDVVTATLSGSAANAIIAVSRYSGADAAKPLGSVTSANTTSNGACVGGFDTNAYLLNLTTTLDGSLLYGAATMRAKKHKPGDGYAERAEMKQGTGGDVVSLAVEDKTNPLASTAAVDGSFNGNVDWAVVALEVKPQKYDLTVNTSGSGSVNLELAGSNVLSGGTYNAGVEIMLTAIPESGFEFSGWSGDLTGVINPATVTMDANKNVTATFTPKPTLTVNTAGSGSVGINPSGGVYNTGDVVTLTAAPGPGFVFSGWSGDLSGSDNPATITMDASKTVTATFIGNGDPSTNLAKNQPVLASSSIVEQPPESAVDANLITFWRSGKVTKTNPSAWLRVDLGASQKLGRAIIRWKGSYHAKIYELQVSDDDVNWTTVYTNTAGKSGVQQFVFPQTTARYVRFYMNKANSGSYRMLEFEVYSGPLAKRTVEAAEAPVPQEIVLEQNYPNPLRASAFNPTTSISYALPRDMKVTLKVYNLNGQVVATLVNGYQSAGRHEASFNASRLPSGNYFTVLQAGEEKHVRRIVLMK